MTTIVLLAVTGLGLAALYFLAASGLTLVFGLADVLNLAHGLLVSVGAYTAWVTATSLGGSHPSTRDIAIAVVAGTAAGALAATVVEVTMIRPLYQRTFEQILITVGLSLAGVALLQIVWGTQPLTFPKPAWTATVSTIAGMAVPNHSLILIAAAATVLIGLTLFLRHTRIGLIVRAGVQDREMVIALGVNVRTAFTVVFAIGGAAAALGGALGGIYFGAIDPSQGAALLIFAIGVVIIGGKGSITGTAVAATVVGLLQQFVNYYAAAGAGDLCVIALLAAVVLVRPQGLAGGKTA
ncbi:branched-chain amino acid ABC transporter permease [Acrocarpospora macrocephala]|uniref:Branched-chain amino acid ABC transporter permease n=1 Tax=Acrocarpospora macrocephala TaxID=150177 RepID=A0A5M3WIP3_9ACTN|nr:branched-chain amino acid ABC transporter permease [Acrocarpospora macrocephala]GES08039.1 branched-chain amino acid ABC transporter permease [Acrocarpospora macrocephala]